MGRTALVTGASQRLGAGFSRALAHAGVHVLVHYHRSNAAAASLARELQQSGTKAWTLEADLSDTEAALALMDRAVELSGGVDILINNASLFWETRFSETTPENVLQNMMVNALSPMILSRRFAAQERPGAILNLLDTMITDYDKRHVPYHLSKRALHSLTRIMASEFAPAVRVNAVAPGLVLPPADKGQDYLESLRHTNPLQRYGTVNDVVAAGMYLLQAEFVTGQIIYVDGGRHMRGNFYGA